MYHILALALSFSLILGTVSANQSQSLTRSQFISTLWEELGALPCAISHPFTDLSQGDNVTAISWFYQEGLLNGTGETTFSPDTPITREEVAIFLRRTAYWLDWSPDFTSAPLGLSLCNDNEGISPWADDSLYWACSTKLMDWSPGGLLDPQGTLSEEALRQILQNFFAL